MGEFWGRSALGFAVLLAGAVSPYAVAADDAVAVAPVWKTVYADGWDVALNVKAQLFLSDDGAVKECKIIEPVELRADTTLCPDIEITEEAVSDYKALTKKPGSVSTYVPFSIRVNPRAPGIVAAEAIKAGDWRLASRYTDSFATIPFGWVCLKPVLTNDIPKLMGVPNYLRWSKPWDETDFRTSGAASLAFEQEYNRLLLAHPNSPYRGICAVGDKLNDAVFAGLKTKFDTTRWLDDGTAAAAARAGNHKPLIERITKEEWAISTADKHLSMSPIEWAIARGDIATADVLLPHLNGTKGKKPVINWAEKSLYAAMRFRRPEMVDWIIENGKPDYSRMIQLDSPSFGWFEQSFGPEKARKLIDYFVRSSAQPLEVVTAGIIMELRHRSESVPMTLASRYALALPIVGENCHTVGKQAGPDCKRLQFLLSTMERADDLEYFLATRKVDQDVISENILQSVELKQVNRLAVFLRHGFDRQQVVAKLRNRWNLPKNFVQSHNIGYVEDYKWHTYKPDPEREKQLAIERDKVRQEREKLIRAENMAKEKQILDLLSKAGFSADELPLPGAG